MQSFRKFACLFTVLAGTLFLTACPSETTISKINGDPGRYKNREVAVVGRVTDSFGVMGTGAYEVDDGTGRIWVATQRGVPSRGSRVGVKGHVHSGLTVGGRTFGTILEENDRRIREK